MLKQRKEIKVTITKLLKIVELLSQVKDHDDAIDDVYKRVAAALKYKILPSEIEEFAGWYLTEDAENMGYDKSHYDDAILILEDFSKNYCDTLNLKGK